MSFPARVSYLRQILIFLQNPQGSPSPKPFSSISPKFYRPQHLNHSYTNKFETQDPSEEEEIHDGPCCFTIRIGENIPSCIHSKHSKNILSL